ncbi:MAG TPA: IclR family transcriptional regulator [Casimicrobiaceae bacterium]|nr:IclR family transcriptional regulator [Casimicrobiaceae bacterium]
MAGKLDRTPPLLRAFALLERIARADGPVTLREAADGSALPKPTVHRMLAMLEGAGLLLRESDGRVSPGPRLARFALEALLNAAVRAPRHAILAGLAEDVGETVNLTMLDGSEVVYLDRVESAWPLRMTLQPGSRVPLHCTASGKLLLALLPAARRAKIVDALELERHTARTITDRRALAAELTRIRRERVATDDEEYLAGLVCIAVPVATPAGRVVASVAVHAPVARMPLAVALGHRPLLENAARDLGTTFEAAKDAAPRRRG